MNLSSWELSLTGKHLGPPAMSPMWQSKRSYGGEEGGRRCGGGYPPALSPVALALIRKSKRAISDCNHNSLKAFFLFESQGQTAVMYFTAILTYGTFNQMGQTKIRPQKATPNTPAAQAHKQHRIRVVSTLGCLFITERWPLNAP